MEGGDDALGQRWKAVTLDRRGGRWRCVEGGDDALDRQRWKAVTLDRQGGRWRCRRRGL